VVIQHARLRYRIQSWYVCLCLECRSNGSFTKRSVFFAYAVITHESALLFVNPNQVDEEARVQLGDQVEVKPYDTFLEYLKELPGALNLSKDNVSGSPHPVQLYLFMCFDSQYYLEIKAALP
jgi:hypothetical protein